MKKEIVKDGVKYTVTIKNEGQIDTSGNLNIYADNQLSKKLETTEIKTVKAGEIREISVQYNTKDMKFDADLLLTLEDGKPRFHLEFPKKKKK